MGMLGYVNFTGCTEINGLSTTLTGCRTSQLAGRLPSKSKPNVTQRKEQKWDGRDGKAPRLPASQKKSYTTDMNGLLGG